MIIRKAKIGDLKRVSYVTRLAWKVPYNKLGFVNSFHENKQLVDLVKEKKMNILVAIEDNKIVGAIRYELRGEGVVFFSKLVVLSTYRRRGIGTKLISKLEKISKNKGVSEICLDIMEEKLLNPFYQKIGYRIVKKIKHFDHHDIYMKKRIK